MEPFLTRSMFRRALGLCAAVSLSLSTMATAVAGPSALSIAPLGSTMVAATEGRPPQEVFNLTNAGTSDATFEVTILKWDQDPEGHPVYSDAPEFLVFPRTLTIKPGATRAVRVMWRPKDAQAPQGQRMFRVQFREIPKAIHDENGELLRVSMVTRVLVPLILEREGFDAQPEFVVRAAAEGLRVHNTGEALLKLSSLWCGDQRVAGLTYVHPGVAALLGARTCTQPLKAVREGQQDSFHEIVQSN